MFVWYLGKQSFKGYRKESKVYSVVDPTSLESLRAAETESVDEECFECPRLHPHRREACCLCPDCSIDESKAVQKGTEVLVSYGCFNE